MPASSEEGVSAPAEAGAAPDNLDQVRSPSLWKSIFPPCLKASLDWLSGGEPATGVVFPPPRMFTIASTLEDVRLVSKEEDMAALSFNDYAFLSLIFAPRS